jgi:hypothetical protein
MIDQAQHHINEATRLIKQAIMTDTLIGNDQAGYVAFLDLWGSLYELDRLIKNWDEDEDAVKRNLLLDDDE